ncbi:hypothetical protein CWE09_01565 [Aliidiomarina minuta]|uniref:homoserine dehydrogenase n=1 Tax=Aliidiomarina minuta TaxID=880057 RepID=A0A432W5Z3_9GAMM|nr:hypothetical protein [Aliidiomarina minuta]RUO25451.1 hypothetical protein CWE09_01565 [Aliidiomarina minuta]
MPLNLIIIGTGNIASYWLQYFAEKLPTTIRVHALVNSKGLHLVSTERPVYKQIPHSLHQEADTQSLVSKALASLPGPKAVVDLTASKIISRAYTDWVKQGAHLISANKYAGSAAPDFYQKLRDTLGECKGHWLYNTTVGAGLPIQKAIAERRSCHDEIVQLEGNFSGSLSWIFQQYRAGDRFSEWLLKAAEMGMTEPDPRVDLSGLDVARKLLILARDAGWPLQLADIELENLVPEELRAVSLEQFWQHLPLLDDFIEQRQGGGWQYHYLGRVSRACDGRIRAVAGLYPIATNSPYAHLVPGNANFVIHSLQYGSSPLIIQGPGAGREVTAAGVHSDILELSSRLS